MSPKNSNANSLYSDVSYAYWNDICDIEPIPLDEQKRLIKLIKDGDKASRDILIESFLRLVVSRAKLYCYDFDSFMDLVQEGNIGLMVAIEKFDPDKGCQFSTYATTWIDKYIRRVSCRTSNPLYVPEKFRQLANRLLIHEKIFTQENNREPSVIELAELMDMTVEQIYELQSFLKPTLSLEQEIKPTDDKSNSFFNIVADNAAVSPENIVLAKDTKNTLETFMKQNLTPIEFSVLKMRFGLSGSGEPQTQIHIAKQYGLTQAGVSKIEIRAINKLNKAMIERGLTRYDFTLYD